jgi:hypothetical protein
MARDYALAGLRRTLNGGFAQRTQSLGVPDDKGGLFLVGPTF